MTFSFQHTGPRDQIRVFRLGSKHLYPLSYLPIPKSFTIYAFGPYLSLSFLLNSFTFHSWIQIWSAWVNFCAWCEEGVWFHSFTCVCSFVFSAFVKDSVIDLLLPFVNHQFTLGASIHLWTCRWWLWLLLLLHRLDVCYIVRKIWNQEVAFTNIPVFPKFNCSGSHLCPYEF